MGFNSLFVPVEHRGDFKMKILLIVLAICFTNVFSQDVVSFQIFGTDDGIKSNREQDYKEALLDAKIKALDRVGIQIKTETEISDYNVIKEIVESKSEGVILPGMSITEMGYSDDGFYQVLIIGEIKSGANGVIHKKLKYVLKLYQRLEYDKAKVELNKIINTSNEDELVAEALYLKIKWKFAENYLDEFEKLKVTYPESKFVEKAKIIVDNFQKKEEEKKSREIKDGTIKATFEISSELPYAQTGFSPLKGATFRGIGNFQIKNYQDIYLRGCCIGNSSNNYQQSKKELFLDFDKTYELEVQYYFYNDKSYAYEKNKFIKLITPTYNKNVKSFLVHVKFDKNAGVSAKVEAQY